MARTPAQLAAAFDELTSPGTLARVRRAVADELVTPMESGVARTLGGDRRMSGLKGAGAITARVTERGVELGPPGALTLATFGRRASGAVIKPRRAKALLTPRGPRARATVRPSRPLGTADDAMTAADRAAPELAERAVRAELTRQGL